MHVKEKHANKGAHPRYLITANSQNAKVLTNSEIKSRHFTRKPKDMQAGKEATLGSLDMP